VVTTARTPSTAPAAVRAATNDGRTPLGKQIVPATDARRALLSLRSLCLALAVLSYSLTAGEVRLDLPEEFPPGVVVSGKLVLTEISGRYEIAMPSVDGLAMQVQSQPSARISSNGRLTVIHHVAVRAAQNGSLIIPPVTVLIPGGERVQSAPLTISVSPGNPLLIGDGHGEVAFVPDRIVPGQPTTLVYRCYLRVGERTGVGVAPPAEAIRLGEPTERAGSTFSPEGEPWSLTTITWPMTMPTPGTYEVRGQQRAQVGDLFRTQRFAFAVKPATLTVLPLPAAGRPTDFNGLIGPLTLAARLERDRIAAGEGTRLELVISGLQAGLAVRPPLAPIAGLQAYPREQPAGDGSRTFAWDLVPTQPGDYRVPAFSLAYFDPLSASYRRAETPSLVLSVLPGRSSGLVVAGGTMPSPPPSVDAGAEPASANVFIPFHGGAPWQPPRAAAALVFLAALALGLVSAAALRLVGQAPRRAHRGRTLARAIAAGDLAAASSALAAVLPDVDGEARDRARALQERIDLARFGGQPLGDVGALVRVLEGRP